MRLQRQIRKISGLALSLTLGAGVSLMPGSAAGAVNSLRVSDLGLQTKFQDSFFGHFKRGRAMIAADFDLDGRIDFYSGNPGDEIGRASCRERV